MRQETVFENILKVILVNPQSLEKKDNHILGTTMEACHMMPFIAYDRLSLELI